MPAATVTPVVAEKDLLESVIEAVPATVPVEEVLHHIRVDSQVDPTIYLDETVTPDGGE